MPMQISDTTSTRPGPDGRRRCPWALGSDLEREYHDVEWGAPVRDEAGLFERLMLEANQSGLSWAIILAKRDRMRAAYADFDPDRVAQFDQDDVQRLLADPGVIRNRRKIEAAITNARAVLGLREGPGLVDLVWSHQPPPAPRPRHLGQVQSQTEASAALAKALKKAGFVFVGPTTCHATMQAIGMVDDHLVDCEVSPNSPLT